MMKMRLAAVMGAAIIVMMSCSGTPAYAEEKGNAVTVETVTEGTETKTENETEAEEKNSREEEGILTSVPLDPSVMTRLTAGMDPEIVEVLLENPKLMALLMPTLHVTVTDSAVKIAFKEQEPAEPVTVGTVRTNGGNLNVRAGASISSAVISHLKNGTEVKVLGEKDGWYEIEIPSEYAWVCGKYLQVTRTTPQETEEGYTFDIDGDMMLGFLKLFEDCFRPEPEPVPDPEGLTPDGNLTLVDDFGPVTGVGQQFLTMVSKNGNYFYMVIDRNDKGEENVHLLNMVDERDLMDLMAKDDKGTYEAITEAEKAAAEAAAQAEKEAAEKAEPFTSKDGREFTRIRIPNQDPKDKTPWASFVLPSKSVHENQYGKGLWAKIPADGTTVVTKPTLKGQDEKGRNIWDNVKTNVPNRELKSMVEAYKTRTPQAREPKTEAPRESAREKLDSIVKDTAEKLSPDKQPKARGKTKAKGPEL